MNLKKGATCQFKNALRKHLEMPACWPLLRGDSSIMCCESSWQELWCPTRPTTNSLSHYNSLPRNTISPVQITREFCRFGNKKLIRTNYVFSPFPESVELWWWVRLNCRIGSGRIKIPTTVGVFYNSVRLIDSLVKSVKLRKNNNPQMVTHLSIVQPHSCLTLVLWPFTLKALTFGSCWYGANLMHWVQNTENQWPHQIVSCQGKEKIIIKRFAPFTSVMIDTEKGIYFKQIF